MQQQVLKRLNKTGVKIFAGAVLVMAATTVTANAHFTGFPHRHGNVGAAIGLGLAGAIIGGAIINGTRARSNHCHGSSFCHRHSLRGPHYHNSRGRVIYKRPRAPRVVRTGNRHINWCYAKYRSYRASDNTFQPYKGRRRACISPFY